MTVLVTGAGGFLGRAVMSRGTLAWVGVLRKDVDLKDPEAVRRIWEKVRPERVIHLAASLDKGAAPESRTRQWEDTFLAGRVVIEASAAVGVRHLIMAGSIEELGAAEGVISPDAAPAPVSFYGLCKSLLRETALFWARQGTFRVDWFRPFVVYGPGQDRGGMLLPTAFRAAREGKPADFSDGLQRRDFIYIDDIVDWILRTAELPLPSQGGGFHTHHLGTGEAVEVRTVLEALREEFPSAEFRLGALPRRAGEPSVQAAPSPAPHDPAWKPSIKWREGISRTADWWRGLSAGRK